MNGYLEREIERDDGKWVKHSPHHWSRFVGGQRLDFWPSKSKYQIAGKIYQGDVYDAIAELST